MVLVGGIMKVVDFLNKIQSLKYDKNTDLDILLMKNGCIPQFLIIDDIDNCQDCSNINSIGIVLTEKGDINE